jgi:hypothetical protein
MTLLEAYTLFHVLISLIAIAAGLITAFAMLSSKPAPALTALFLWTTLATSVTGFFFPFHGFTPALAFGILSLLILAISFAALYKFRLAGAWRWLYVISALFALYLNCFVLVVQSFQKIPILHDLAPTGAEPPFAIAQLIVLVLFILLTTLATRRYHPALAQRATPLPA